MHRISREMITNTLAHADHFGRQGIVIIRKPDSLQFANPGDMRPGLKLALLGGTSDARNSSIMKMFGLLDFGERAGSGIPDMMDVCMSEVKEAPVYKVTYAPSRTVMTINIEKYAIADNNTEKLTENSEGVIENSEGVTENQEKLIEKVIEKFNKNGDKVTENRLSVIRLILATPTISKAELADKIGISVKSISKNLEYMRGKYIRRVGPDKGGYWEII